MKKLFLFTVLSFLCGCLAAQQKEQITLRIDRNENLPAQTARTQHSLALESGNTRGLVSLGVGALSSWGSQALFQLIDNKEAKKTAEWAAPAGRDYFYSAPSFLGPLDPSGLHFRGITLKREEYDAEGNPVTALLVQCSFPEERLEEFLVSHQFTLQVDTLVIDLSRVKTKYTRKKIISIQIGITIKATWMDETLQIHQDQTLGAFNICLPGLKYDPKHPVITYTAEQAKDLISGSSFFIPRSYSAFVSGTEYKPCWSQGEFEAVLSVKESTAGKSSKTATFIRTYLESALPATLQQMATNENIVGKSVVEIVKNY